MSLKTYEQKRDFTKTAEPKAGKSKDKDHLIFVIQKHDATRLHYDFRLEMEGVLKSWAVPKGPSTNPHDKRLAMMVEDHPFDYLNFEGIIPKGQYGGGTVIVWDEGTYEPIEKISGKKAQEKHLLKQLKAGSLKIKLHGEKLEGEFALVKTHGMGENAWLLIKHNDEFASEKDVTKEDKSILSGKSIETMEKTSEKVWQHGKEEVIELPENPIQNSDKRSSDANKSGGKSGLEEKASKKKLKTEPTEDLSKEADDSSGDNSDINTELSAEEILKKAPTSKIPLKVLPMKATAIDEPFDDPGWLYEVKWDGYRSLAFLEKGKVELISRNSKSFNDKFYPIPPILEKLKLDAVLDGEILVLDKKGISNFGRLQNWRSEADGDLIYYVFDVLWLNGKNLMNLSLRGRQAVLKSILPEDDDRLRLSKVFEARGIEFFKAAERLGLEGVIAKKAESTYSSDLRSREWLKIKVHKRQEVIITGFTRNEDTSKSFSSLLLGVYQNGVLTYAGKVGTGFSDQDQRDMMKQFKPLIIDKSPFRSTPDVNKPSRFNQGSLNAKATWMKPELVCEVAYTEITTDGVFRHPSFQAMRIDKQAKDVVLEIPAATEEVVKESEETQTMKNAEATKDTEKSQAQQDHKENLVKPPKHSERKTLLNPKDETQVRTICGHDLKFTNLSKIYWPEDKVTKRDMFNFYYQIADFILPYLKDRPMSLNRFPNGIHGPSFYQKDVTGKAPDWAKTCEHVTAEGKKNHYLVGSDEATLLWMASLGCIEMNPWFSRKDSADEPDYCVIDLDPDKQHFDQVVQTALAVKDVLDELNVPCFCKTSGSTGMHIYIPLEGKYSYDQSQLFAKIVVSIVQKQLPDFTTLERSISERKGKMYLDFLQNRPGATIAGPYSLRPKVGATVSMPLAWEEVKPGLKMTDFSIFNSLDRLKETGDLFRGVLDKGIDLEKTIQAAKGKFDV